MKKVITATTVTPIRRRTGRPGLVALLLATLLLAACASQQPADPDQKSSKRKAAESNTALGLEYMNRGQYEVALGKLKKATRDDPGYAPAQTVMAVLYERIGEFEQAGKHYRKAWEISPDDGDVNNNYGVYLCQNGNRPQAMERFRTALDDPFYSSPAVALTNAGACAMQAGDMPAADEYLRRALKIEPDFADALMTMARLNYLEKNFLKSRAFMQRYEAVAQHNAESLLLAYRIEKASSDSRAANRYKLLLESNFPESRQAEEVRRNPAP
jgi:type IV pilus assembly protein PilF